MDEQSSPGRYRGRRRVPAPPRGRYAAVVTTAVVGAGVVALGAGSAFDDAKLDPERASALGTVDLSALESRAEVAERASRAEREGGLATSISQQAPDVWLLPLHSYTYTSDYGWRWDRMHNGVDLAAPPGTPIYAMHAGRVVSAGWHGGYGYMVAIDHGDGLQTLYAHASEVLVTVGQEVSAGDRVALVGNTGYSFGPHLHLEIHHHGVPQEPTSWFEERGVDLLRATDQLYGS